jgi:hypothetical protein
MADGILTLVSPCAQALEQSHVLPREPERLAVETEGGSSVWVGNGARSTAGSAPHLATGRLDEDDPVVAKLTFARL